MVVQSPTAPVSVSNTPGGATPREAVQKFMAAAKSQDLQAMSMAWGTSSGPASATMDQTERDQREVVMMCYLKHDTYSIISDAPAANNERIFAVELRFKGLTKSSNFTATRGPSDRWYLRAFDPEPLKEICATR